ncbi:SPOR domain-containing protein [Chitinimonas sp.]|uniref:SPOR domain-containing protein n=1 Tax=Chitinimonas sp. TaxID=1934313 RepID=UPI0035B1C34E
MKWLFALLVFANLGFWAYARLDAPPAPNDWKGREINAGKLALVPIAAVRPAAAAELAKPEAIDGKAVDGKPADKPAEKTAEAAPAKPEPAPPAKPVEQAAKKDEKLVCFAWRGILADDMPNVRKKLASLKLGGDTHLQEPEGEAKVRYWVYIPPRASNAEAQHKADELKSLGVSDYFLVNDGSKWQNAISLGLFANRDSAERRLKAIRDQGVRSAQMQERNEGNAGNTLVLKHVAKSAKPELEKAAQGFRGSSIGDTAC